MKQFTPFLAFAFLFHTQLFAGSSVTIIPFGYTCGLVIVQANVDGKNGFYLLDTGTPNLTLNRRIFQGEPSSEILHGINGSESEVQKKLAYLTIADFEKETMAIISDLTAIEAHTKLPICGVIGTKVFEDCEVVFDFVFKELTIYKLDGVGHPNHTRNLHEPPREILPFQLKGSMPLVEVLIGGQLMRLALDSGASMNVLDEKNCDTIDFCMEKLGNKELISFGTQTRIVPYCRIGEIKVGDIQCLPMCTLLFSLNKLNRDLPGPDINGILGIEFLSRYRTAINFRKMEFYIWDTKHVQEQWAARTEKVKEERK